MAKKSDKSEPNVVTEESMKPFIELLGTVLGNLSRKVETDNTKISALEKKVSQLTCDHSNSFSVRFGNTMWNVTCDRCGRSVDTDCMDNRHIQKVISIARRALNGN